MIVEILEGVVEVVLEVAVKAVAEGSAALQRMVFGARGPAPQDPGPVEAPKKEPAEDGDPTTRP